MPQERLQKILARSGLGSRRKCEEFIKAGRVTVNGRTIVLGGKADPQIDDIRLDGDSIQVQDQPVYIILNKPLGVLSSLKSQGGHRTVIDLIDISERVFPVGRLDLDSQGLILLTNDGDLANKLTHPKFGHEKEYQVLLNRPPDSKQITTWRRGVTLQDGVRTFPAKVEILGKSGESRWLRVILKQGRKRQIRETAMALGLKVKKIVRVRIGPIRLGNLKSGLWRPLTNDEERKLRASLQRTPRQLKSPRGKRGPARKKKTGRRNPSVR
jgi:23S rRNA pseudouridine2605 synthase